MSAALLHFSAKLHSLALCISVVLRVGLYFGVLACFFLIGFYIFGMPEDSQYYSWTVVQPEHELALRGATTKGKKKDLSDR